MSGNWFRWGLSTIAIGVFAALLWFTRWMQTIPIGYIVMINFAIMGLVWSGPTGVLVWACWV